MLPIATTCLVTMVAVLHAAGARAEQGAVDAFEVRWEVDVPVAAAAGLTGAMMHMLQDELVRDRCSPTCDPRRVNAFDASTRGRYSAAAHHAGNALVATSVALGPAVALVGAWGSDHDDRWEHALEDTALIAEVLGVSVLLHQVTAFATQRPRPYVYGSAAPEELRSGADAYLSFYSGHTATAFGVATATSYLFSKRHPGSPWVLPVWTLTHGLAALQGTTRVMAGYHYPSDVLVGAAIGSALGLTIPILHELDHEGRSWSVAPQAMLGGAGVVLHVGPRAW